MSEQTPSMTYLRRAHRAECEVAQLRARLAEVVAELQSERIERQTLGAQLTAAYRRMNKLEAEKHKAKERK